MPKFIYASECPSFKGELCQCGNNGGGDCDYCSEMEYFHNNPEEVQGLTFEQFREDVHTPPARPHSMATSRRMPQDGKFDQLFKIYKEVKREQRSLFKSWSLPKRPEPEDFGDQSAVGKIAAAFIIAVCLLVYVVCKGRIDMPRPTIIHREATK